MNKIAKLIKLFYLYTLNLSQMLQVLTKCLLISSFDKFPETNTWFHK